MNKKKIFFTAAFALLLIQASFSQPLYHEKYRPQIHFTPKQHWMNDPNGMVFYKGIYHLFFQYYPDSTVWGPMHWGHTTSKDLVHWQEQPIALYPDSLGYIFSGSAVIDTHNTSGFGKNGIVPLVAIFTNHDPNGEKAGSNHFQNQSIAYSLDEGNTWVKYAGNPVLKNPGITDFRDPKVMWYEEGQKWIMTLATKDRVTFYSSENLKDWIKESDFGANIGAHGGVWECPDLFSLTCEGKKVWVLLASINPGGPNGGSATQYFTGDFDGHTFYPYNNNTKWVDYGRDNYAGITWSNTSDRKIFLGWMNNWQYANVVPTKQWRGATTIPRELALQNIDNSYYLILNPVQALTELEQNKQVVENISLGQYNFGNILSQFNGSAMIHITSDKVADIAISLSNNLGEKLVVGYNKMTNEYYINRMHSGKLDFEKNFSGKSIAPRIGKNNYLDMTLVIDVASVELFTDGGLSVLTDIMFPNKPYNHIELSGNKMMVKKLEYVDLKSIWP